MSVHKKLMQARLKLQGTKLSKSGHNKFAGYKYFELGDFLPVIQDIFADLGLCGYISYSDDLAELKIIDTETEGTISITSPMSSAALKGAHDIQNLGAVQTYLRRYLWVTAMEIVEHDILDATLGSEPKAPKPKPATKPPVNQPTDTSWAISIQSEDKWVESVMLGTTESLKFAESKDDVLQIFKVNRPIFERLMAEDKEQYDKLMAQFAEHKNRFKE